MGTSEFTLHGHCSPISLIVFRYLYVFNISYDGSFQLFRKSKAYNQWDVCLSEGRKYFVHREEFAKHLARADKARNSLSTRVGLIPCPVT